MATRTCALLALVFLSITCSCSFGAQAASKDKKSKTDSSASDSSSGSGGDKSSSKDSSDPSTTSASIGGTILSYKELDGIGRKIADEIYQYKVSEDAVPADEATQTNTHRPFQKIIIYSDADIKIIPVYKALIYQIKLLTQGYNSFNQKEKPKSDENFMTLMMDSTNASDKSKQPAASGFQPSVSGDMSAAFATIVSVFQANSTFSGAQVPLEEEALVSEVSHKLKIICGASIKVVYPQVSLEDTFRFDPYLSADDEKPTDGKEPDASTSSSNFLRCLAALRKSQNLATEKLAKHKADKAAMAKGLRNAEPLIERKRALEEAPDKNAAQPEKEKLDKEINELANNLKLSPEAILKWPTAKKPAPATPTADDNTKPASTDPYEAYYENLNTEYTALMTGLTSLDTNGTTLFATILRVESVYASVTGKAVGAKGTTYCDSRRLVRLKICAGGTEDKTTNHFWGGNLYNAGGTVVSYMIFDEDGGTIEKSNVFYGMSDFEKPSNVGRNWKEKR